VSEKILDQLIHIECAEAQRYLDGEVDQLDVTNLLAALIFRYWNSGDPVVLATIKLLENVVAAAMGRDNPSTKQRQMAVWNTLGLSGVKGHRVRMRDMCIALAVRRLKDEGDNSMDAVATVANAARTTVNTVRSVCTKYRDIELFSETPTTELIARLPPLFKIRDSDRPIFIQAVVRKVPPILE
jgi:hypothetical protein